jgi:peptidoglycan/xylan/chitin deacetylase (PgdA/CDA1 family)
VSRTLLKAVVERALTFRLPQDVLQRRAAGRKVILAYHNILPQGEEISGDPGCHLPVGSFREQLDIIEELCEVMPLDVLLRAPASDSRLQAAITFDDAYVGTLCTGLPELARRGLPSTVFVPTGLIGKGAFWWDEFAITGWDGDREPISKLRGDRQLVRSWAVARGICSRPQGPSQVAATEAELLAAASVSGVSVGAHTVGHLNLSELPPAEVGKELDQSRCWLRQRFPDVSNWVSYPYGLFSPAVEEIARQLGFLGGVSIGGGHIALREDERFTRPRVLVPAGINSSNFLLRLFGVLKT